MGQPVALRRGDVLPFCSGMSSDHKFYSFEDQAGRPVALILAGLRSPAEMEPLSAAFAALAPAFAAQGADICILAQIGAPGWILATPPEGMKLVHCPDRAIFDASGEAPAVLLADRGLRLVAWLDGSTPGAAAETALELVRALPREASTGVCPAPVLVRPGLLDSEMCLRLIERFEGGEHMDGTVA
ncbi:MAG TPA: hypothetical protein VHX64_13445, partial [Caulobacteraceae bacterium]|nr:hypothetical protein [Caulobacteraceae bacterium]